MEADRDKARAFLTHLAVASEKFRERQVSRSRLAEQLKKLRTVNVKDMQQHLQELEYRIADALNKEKRILKALHHEHRICHDTPSQKVHREVAYVPPRDEPAPDPKEAIRKNLAALETMYHNLKKEKYPKNQLERIEKRIQDLKDKL